MLIYILLMQYHVDISESLYARPKSFSRVSLTVRASRKKAHDIHTTRLSSFAEESNAVVRTLSGLLCMYTISNFSYLDSFLWFLRKG